MKSNYLSFILLVSFARLAAGQILKPLDAPQPLSPEASQRCVRLPGGYRLELVASEPLIREPSGVCWDERGQLFVCELHGYNLEGQYDIDELNNTGQLDRVVRRIQANDQAKQAAKRETYGTIKRLLDSDHDGRMDQALVFADRLPACHGICPARGGLIAACTPDVIYLADRDGDGTAEIREVLFSGFDVGPLERSINCPQWGPDNWIYLGQGHGGGRIVGPYLKQPVELPRTNFRIQADGTAIEPIGGSTHTLGFTFTAEGDMFVVATNTPGIHVAPLPWRSLARNPDVAIRGLEENAASYDRTFPISQPHPWRTKRAGDPGFSAFYTEHYGIDESTPNGYFTSGCSPLVYQDAALPGLQGQLLACEPSQNLVHRALIVRKGSRLVLHRTPAEQAAEFLASSDAWFHPIALSHAPDGSIAIVDFYREIIEDYSAIPRYLQQQYGLTAGRDRGRIWRLVHDDLPRAPALDMSQLSAGELGNEVGGNYFWRRQTARRLIVERGLQDAVPTLVGLVGTSADPAAAISALYALEGLGALRPDLVDKALQRPMPAVRVHALRLAERWFHSEPLLFGRALELVGEEEPAVLLQTALSLGESSDPRSISVLAQLAQRHGDVQWMHDAVMSSLAGKAGVMLTHLLQAPHDLRHARSLVVRLCAAIGARRDAAELSTALVEIGRLADSSLQGECLKGLQSSVKAAVVVDLSDAARKSLLQLAVAGPSPARAAAQELARLLSAESPSERAERLSHALSTVADIQSPVAQRLQAASDLGREDDPQVASSLLEACQDSPPQVRQAILAALFVRKERLPLVLEAIERGALTAASLSAVQRAALLEHQDAGIRERSAKLLTPVATVDPNKLRSYVAALENSRDLEHGRLVFRQRCATCHQAHGEGVAVGPDLTAEFQRAEETIVSDVLAPNAAITPGFGSYSVETLQGLVETGLFAGESPSSIVLRKPEGRESTVLRKDLAAIKAMPVSLMPDNLAEVVSPQELADAIAWLRSPPQRRVLFDDSADFLDKLPQGSGDLSLEYIDKLAGLASLRVTPLQRHASHIAGWNFRVREQPQAGEYRYLRFAWKSEGATGAMIELANDGRWPPAQLPQFRYYAGRNSTPWQATEVSSAAPAEWTVVVRDLWKDFGDSTLTGIAPTAMESAALFDRIELWREPPPEWERMPLANDPRENSDAQP